MTDPRMPAARRPFTPAELEGAEDATAGDLAADARIARDLERLVAGQPPVPSTGFADRVMAAVALEPTPAPALAARSAARRGAAGAFLAAVRDAFRMSVSGGFPAAARAQALALVVVVAVLAAGSGIATAGALGLLDARPSTPEPSLEAPTGPIRPSPSVPPAESVSPSPSPSPSLEPAEPSETPEATEEGETESPDDTPGQGGSDGGQATGTPHDDHETSEPDSHDDHADESPMPTRTLEPGETPRPTETPHDD